MAASKITPATHRTDDRHKNPDDDPRGPYVLCDVTAPFERPNLIYSWRGHFPPQGRSWRYTQARAQQLTEQGRIVFPSKGGRPRLKRYLNESDDSEATDEKSSLTARLECIVRAGMRAIATEIARNPGCLRDVEWRDLERTLREVFEALGFATQLTRSSKDGGFDLRLQCDAREGGRTFLVEVKHWLASKKKVGVREFSALVDIVAKAADKPTGLLLSSSGFTPEVVNGRTEVERQVVKLGGHQKIVSLYQCYLQRAGGVWRPASDLPGLILQGTF